MADIALTPSNVVPGTDASLRFGTAGQSIPAGKAVYLSRTTKKYMLADNNSTTPEARTTVGIAVNSAAPDQPLAVQSGGDIALGTVLVPNTPYFLSDTPGGICPIGDLGAGEYVCQVLLSKSTTVATIIIRATGVAN